MCEQRVSARRATAEKSPLSPRVVRAFLKRLKVYKRRGCRQACREIDLTRWREDPPWLGLSGGQGQGGLLRKITGAIRFSRFFNLVAVPFCTPVRPGRFVPNRPSIDLRKLKPT
jgi:hypothetical protein